MNFERFEHKYRRFLSSKSMFYTKERKKLLKLLFAKKGHLSANTILNFLKEEKVSISRATLYRSLAQMVEAGVLKEADFGHGHTHYELCLDEQDCHAHFVCKQCGVIIELKDDYFNVFIKKMAFEKGLEVDSCNMQISGYCQNCLIKKKQ